MFFFQICAKTGNTKTFIDLYNLSIIVAKNLQRLGGKKGQVIYVTTSNTVDIAPLIFAALYLGLTISLMHPHLTKTEYERFVSMINPKYVLCDLELYQLSKQCLESQKIRAQIFTFDGQIDESIAVNTLFENQDENTHLE